MAVLIDTHKAGELQSVVDNKSAAQKWSSDAVVEKYPQASRKTQLGKDCVLARCGGYG
jgi:hypothetical protein